MGKQCSNNTLSQGRGGYPLVSLLTVFFFFSPRYPVRKYVGYTFNWAPVTTEF